MMYQTYATLGAIAATAILAATLVEADERQPRARSHDRVPPPAGGGVAEGGLPEGPDVIVGELPAIHRWAGDGTRTSYSFATTSCNVGHTPLKWIDEDDSNEHPVIAQNLYRLSADGRFEQIGMSWLKHGFCALQQDECGDCDPFGPGCEDHLGVGCSDPYAATRNGIQGGLGPRWEVNPATGVFPIPWDEGEDVDDDFDRRVIVDNNDLDPLLNPGARYFTEGHYVTQDDAAAGHQNNNASYREVYVGLPPGYVLSYDIEPTRRGKAAIEAWADIDEDVTVVPVDVPGDGRFLLAYKVTPGEGGTFDYEYALHNLNSDQAARSVVFPKGLSAVISDAGFHDIDHHSGNGEGGVNQDGTDWSFTEGGSSVSWSTTDFDSNPNANALRWGTLYNFRFSSDCEPRPAEIEIVLFKPGATGSVAVEAMVPCPPCAGDTNNDFTINVEDLTTVILDWGCDAGCAGDVNNDGNVDVEDLTMVILNWGDC